MKKILLTALLFHCYLAQAEISLTYGTETSLKQNPWQVSLQNEWGEHFCGGSIISSRFILTAAHCLGEKGPYDVNVFAGGNGTFSDLTQISQTKKLIIHPEYAGWSNKIKSADIALIELATDIIFSETIAPIKLPGAEDQPVISLPSSANLSVTGWGMTEYDMYSSQLLMIDSLKLMPLSRDSFWENKENQLILDETSFLGSDYDLAQTFRTHHYLGIETSEMKSFCRGDSGGPMVNRTTRTLMGVGAHLSHRNCSDARTFYYTDVYEFMDWIRSEI